MGIIRTAAPERETIIEGIRKLATGKVFLSSENLAELSLECGGYWFAPDTLKFFGTRMGSVATPVMVRDGGDSVAFNFVHRSATGFDGAKAYMIERATLSAAPREDGYWKLCVDIEPMYRADSDGTARATFVSRSAVLRAAPRNTVQTYSELTQD